MNLTKGIQKSLGPGILLVGAAIGVLIYCHQLLMVQGLEI